MDQILFHIYAGMGGGFGGAKFHSAEYFKDAEEAMSFAYDRAVEDYESYCGGYNPPSWDEVADENGLDYEEDSDEISSLYNEEVESWIDYFIVPADEDGEVDGYMYSDTMIDEFDGENAFLSNFFPCQFEFNGKTWKTSEAAFQAAKTLVPAEQEAIRLASTPGKAKRLGRNCTIRSDWEEIKINVMRDIIHAKFTQNPDLKQKLLDTGDKILIEGNNWHDNFWGVCFHCCPRNNDGEKHNVLGVLLYQLRDELRDHNGSMRGNFVSS